MGELGFKVGVNLFAPTLFAHTNNEQHFSAVQAFKASNRGWPNKYSKQANKAFLCPHLNLLQLIDYVLPAIARSMQAQLFHKRLHQAYV